jgi:hypothetical protein
MFGRSRKNSKIKPALPFEVPAVKTQRYLWIMSLWLVMCFLATFGAMYALAFLGESAFDYALRWIELTNK